MPARMRRRITNAKREEIEAEQRILEKTIVRPFEILEGLPISYSEPPNGHYEETLKNPLTIKDSAVLYNSLIRSRSTYAYHAPMFRLHWVKQTAYAKKLAEMDKDRQKEILGDQVKRGRFAKATTNSLEARTRTPVLSPEVNARDVMSKLCESSITLGPHTMDIRIFIAKDSRSEKSRAILELSKLGRVKPETSETESANINSKTSLNDVHTGCTLSGDVRDTPQSNSDSESEVHPYSPILQVDTKSSHICSSSRPQSARSLAAIDNVERQILPGTAGTMNPTIELPVMEGGGSEEQHLEIHMPLESTMSSSNTDVDSCVSRKFSDDSMNNDFNQMTKIEQDNGASTYFKRKAQGTNDFLGSVSSEAHEIKLKDGQEDTDVATGNTKSSAFIESSQFPIHQTAVKTHEVSDTAKPKISKTPVSTSTSRKATAVPDRAHLLPTSPTPVSPGVSSKLGLTPSVRPSPTNLQSLDNTIMISNLNAIAKIDLPLNDLMKEVALGKASEAQITCFKRYIERAKQMGPQPHHAELYFSRGLPLPSDFPRLYLTRPVLDKKLPPKRKVFNPMKLTAFQERYLHNATLVFEFLENPNVRYIIPQDSICEVLKPKYPSPKDAEQGTEFNDLLLSHIWIHNVDEMEKYERDYAYYEAEVRKKEEETINLREGVNEKNLKAEDASANYDMNYKAGSRALRIKKRAPPQRGKQQLAPPESPRINYTTFSFTIHNIPSRFIPIFTNSMKPLKQVQERMKRTLQVGTRTTSFYLWYQVDARLDEEFAESLRTSAVMEERRMSGFVPLVESKKRKPKVTKNLKTKRLKGKSAVVEQIQLVNISGGLHTSAPSSQNPNSSGQHVEQSGLHDVIVSPLQEL